MKEGGNPHTLKPFKKGYDKRREGNGRIPVLPELKEVIAKILNKEEKGTIALEKVINALYARALKGDVRAVQELLDRFFGKVVQPTDNTHKVEFFNGADPDKVKQAVEKLKDAIQPE